ncbi:MAG: hypothetical protein ACYC7L_02775, partial [Nitrospirota bacterium]
MQKFKSYEEYDDWRSRQAIKRQGAKDLAKLDAKHPVSIAETKPPRASGSPDIWSLPQRALFACCSSPHREGISWGASWISFHGSCDENLLVPAGGMFDCIALRSVADS